MWDNIPFIQARFKRGYSETLQDAIRGTDKLKIGMSNITKYTTIASRAGDVGAIIINGYPIIKTALADGKTMEEAVVIFKKFTGKTQQSGADADLSLTQRNKNFAIRTLMRFKNTTNQLVRLQVDANIQFINKQITPEQFATKTFLYSIYSPIMYVLMGYFITQGIKGLFGNSDKDKKGSLLGDIFQQIIIQPFQAIPLIDSAMESAYAEVRKRISGKDYYFGEGLFSYPLQDDIASIWQKLTKKNITTEDWITIISKTQEPLTGIPTEMLRRYYGYTIGSIKKDDGGTKITPIRVKLDKKSNIKIQPIRVKLNN